MGEVIRLKVHKRLSLKEARVFLGSKFFRQALFEWSLQELEACTRHPEACFTGADEAYEAVLRFRLGRADLAGPVCVVVPLRKVA